MIVTMLGVTWKIRSWKTGKVPFRPLFVYKSQIDGLGVLYRVDGIGDDKFPYRYFTGPQRASASKGKYYQGVPIDKLNSDNDFSTTPIENYYDFAANFGNCRHEGGVDFRSGKKPEALVELILKHFSNPGDLVLDSFAGSGTTAAVAHKMGRQWITIELAEQAVTHVVPRIQSVIDLRDPLIFRDSNNSKCAGI